MASEKNLQELFHETLKDIYFAEKKILSALPKMAKGRAVGRVEAAFEKHETETEEHVARLEKVFEEIDETPRGQNLRCDHGDHRGRSGGDEGVQGGARLGRRSPRGGPGGRTL